MDRHNGIIPGIPVAPLLSRDPDNPVSHLFCNALGEPCMRSPTPNQLPSHFYSSIQVLDRKPLEVVGNPGLLNAVKSILGFGDNAEEALGPEPAVGIHPKTSEILPHAGQTLPVHLPRDTMRS